MCNTFSILKIVILTFCCICMVEVVWSQPANNECSSALPLGDVTNYCSNNAEFSNATATPSGFGAADCFTNNSHDLWFSFVAVASDVTVTVNGSSGQGGGGSLSAPEVALYTGDCNGTINNLQCQSDGAGVGIVELYRGALTIGATYYIRVDGRANLTGTFQLCVSNYNPQIVPGSDCVEATILCDKSPFAVQEVIGPGNDPDEASDSCLGGLGDNSESNSTWYAWTARTSGTLTFVLTPTNPADDLDFVLFELPNGPNNCAGKQVVGCMAAGDFNFPSPCMGPTGLRDSSSDNNENPGCGGGNDNWLGPLNMVAGRSYALMINNFTSTGNGFSISFGGTGEFQGPEPGFVTAPVSTACAGENITFTDTSDPMGFGTITNWQWNFGVGASPQIATSQGAHSVSYSTPGTKTISLTVTSSEGCIVTEVRTIMVDDCCNTLNEVNVDVIKQDLECADNLDGSIDLTPSGTYAPFQFEWEDGPNTEDRSGLATGSYVVTVSNRLGCEKIVTVILDGPPAFDVVSDITKPTCNGGVDGAVNLTVGGATPPYTFEWFDVGGGLIATTEDLSNLPIGDYTIVITDANNCQITELYEVRELELELDPNVVAVIEPSCFGFSDGSIQLVVSNGLPPYEFDWNDGNGFVSNNSILNIPAGSYNITIRDANLCFGNFAFDINEPDLLVVDLLPTQVSCYQYTDGFIDAMVSGGTEPYSYGWSIPAHPDSSTVTDLIPGDYSITVTDANGCVATDMTNLAEPPIFLVDDIVPEGNLCFGGNAGSLAITGIGGTPPYTYSVDGEVFQVDSIITDLAAGPYTVYIMDANGCIATDESFITEPFEIIVEARYDQTILLGYSAEIQAVVNTADEHTYTWTPSESLSCADCPEPTAMPVNTTTYVVEILTEFGCTATDSVTIEVDKVRPVYIPNVFTPNDDGINDAFVVFGSPAVAQVREIKVFNRWGDLVYGAENIPVNLNSVGWDGTFNGKRVNPGVFVYLAQVEFIDGEVFSYKGDVTVLK